MKSTFGADSAENPRVASRQTRQRNRQARRNNCISRFTKKTILFHQPVKHLRLGTLIVLSPFGLGLLVPPSQPLTVERCPTLSNRGGKPVAERRLVFSVIGQTQKTRYLGKVTGCALQRVEDACFEGCQDRFKLARPTAEGSLKQRHHDNVVCLRWTESHVYQRFPRRL